MKPILKLLAISLFNLTIFSLSLTWIRAASSTILINAIYYDTYVTNEPDAAFQLQDTLEAARRKIRARLGLEPPVYRSKLAESQPET